MTFYKNWKDVPKKSWDYANFSPREIACKGTGSLLVNDDALTKLQTLRNLLGKPLLLTSAYRSKQHNDNVGGAKRSLHLEGKAFDVRMENQDPIDFERAARAVGFTGFGYYPKSGFMHIDTGPARSWGTPFPVTVNNLPVEGNVTKERETPTKSTTVRAAGAQVATTLAAGGTAVGALDGTAQIVAIVVTAVVVLLALWIIRERLKKWADGEH